VKGTTEPGGGGKGPRKLGNGGHIPFGKREGAGETLGRKGPEKLNLLRSPEQKIYPKRGYAWGRRSSTKGKLGVGRGYRIGGIQR